MIKIGIGIEWEEDEECSVVREIRILKSKSVRVRVFKGG